MDTTTSKELLQAKRIVSDFHEQLEKCDVTEIDDVFKKFTNGNSYVFKSVYPFRELSHDKVCSSFWKPMKQSFTKMQRRPEIFIGGLNSVSKQDEIWVLSMGHFLGLFDRDWLGIRATRRIATLRYAEFTKVENGKVTETGLFMDLVGFMQSVGLNPLPPSTGVHFCYPGPRTGDGLKWTNLNAPKEEGIKTQRIVDKMVDDLSAINGQMTCPPDLLRQSWTDDMIWYGPGGIGASYTIERYQEQHQLPFRAHLGDKIFHGHQVCVAEGSFAAFFGWPLNLTNSNLGGFLGLPSSNSTVCPMQVVDVYRREGNKLAENWVFIDILWYLKHQGLDVLERTTGITNPFKQEEN